MFDSLCHLSSLLSFAAQHGERERHDAAAQRELMAAPLDLPAGLELEWLGTAGYRLSYEGHSIFIDPYLSRQPLGAMLRQRPALSDTALLERLFGSLPGKVAGVLVGHCHFDHAIDAPALARRFNAPAYGSASLVKLMALHGLRPLAVEVVPHRAYELGPFTVRFAPSQHSKLVLGHAVPSDGELSCEHLDALTAGAYRCGQVWGIHIEVAGISVYHQGSANLIDEEIRTRGVDVFLAGIAGRRFTRDYWPRVLGKLQPRQIVASHFDDFLRPIDAPLGYSINVNLAALPEEIRRVSADFRVATLQPLQPVCGGRL